MKILVVFAAFLLFACDSNEGLSSRVFGTWVNERWSDVWILADDGSATYAVERDGGPGRVAGTGYYDARGGVLTIYVKTGRFLIGGRDWDAGEVLEADYSTTPDRSTLVLTIQDHGTFVFTRL